MFGKAPMGTSVFIARMPVGFVSFFGKAYRLDKKLRVASIQAEQALMLATS